MVLEGAGTGEEEEEEEEGESFGLRRQLFCV